MNSPTLQTQLKEFPRSPGVYLMKSQDGTILYIGKAKNLRSRVRSYFTGPKDPKTKVLVSRIETIDYLVTGSEYEALILENNLIKEYTPRYNINLKDGKTYPVIRITADSYPRIFRTRRIIHDGSQYFGPFPSVGSIETYLTIVDTLYPLRKCRGPLKKRTSPCLYYHIGKCPGPCAGLISQQDYGKRVKSAAKMLAAPPEKLKQDLNKKMRAASKALKFEEAAKFRDILNTIEDIFSQQNVVDYDLETRDYLGWFNKDGYQSFVVLQMRGGKLSGTDMFRSEGLGIDQDDLMQFITRYYSEYKRYPEKLYLPQDFPLGELQRFFSDELKASTTIATPTSDRDGAVLNMAQENARQDGVKRINELGNVPALEELQRILDLPTLPVRIEGFDIAQLHGKHTVAAMVSFLQGRPDPKEYRTYHIKSLHGAIDDFESMREAVARRYTRVLNEGLSRPDLILIDGGKGQLSAATGILQALGLEDIPILGLAKQHEEIFLPERQEPITLPPGHPGLRILQGVRDEAHRFGTTLNQKLRSKDIRLEILETIPGMGKVRSKRLMQAFGSVDMLAEADIQLIAQSGGFGLDLAMAVKQRCQAHRGKYTGSEMAAEPDPPQQF